MKEGHHRFYHEPGPVQPFTTEADAKFFRYRLNLYAIQSEDLLDKYGEDRVKQAFMEAEHGLLTDFLKSANTKRPLTDKVKISIENIQEVQVILLKASLKDPTPPHRLTCHFELDGKHFFPSGDRNAYIREILSEQQKLN